MRVNEQHRLPDAEAASKARESIVDAYVEDGCINVEQALTRCAVCAFVHGKTREADEAAFAFRRAARWLHTNLFDETPPF